MGIFLIMWCCPVLAIISFCPMSTEFDIAIQQHKNHMQIDEIYKYRRMLMQTVQHGTSCADGFVGPT